MKKMYYKKIKTGIITGLTAFSLIFSLSVPVVSTAEDFDDQNGYDSEESVPDDYDREGNYQSDDILSEYFMNGGTLSEDGYDTDSNSSGFHITNPENYLTDICAVERLYNPNTGEHFYTSTKEEQNVLVAAGWKDEGIGWYAPKSGDPVYRMYNPNKGEHHYTMSSSERNSLKNAGWNYEGIGWYSNVYKSVPLYRQYNPNSGAFNHNYTVSKAENDRLIYYGWRNEGIAWYGVDTSSSYTNSSLISYVNISPNKTENRWNKIDTITIHHMGGVMSVEKCGELFARYSRRASSNYGIDSDGNIGLYVEEKDRAWTSSNGSNDHRAITIEVSNDGGDESHWHVSDAAMESLIKLCADICRRNGITELKWEADPSLIGQPERQNLTVHKWFAKTECPGPYLFFSHSRIANETNKLLGKETHISPYIYKGFDYSAVYDPDFYVENNADMLRIYGDDRVTPFEHFLSNGMKEKRQASANFNVKVYMEHNPDLVKAFGDDYVAYYKHYCTRGRYEDRISS